MASHIFIGRLVSGDLNQLNGRKHRNPDKLNAYPEDKDERKSVTEHITTQCIIDDATLKFEGGRQDVDVSRYVSRNMHLKTKGILTVNSQPHKKGDANLQAGNVQHEMTQVICPNAVINPWAMAAV